jgi:hypothetical protein
MERIQTLILRIGGAAGGDQGHQRLWPSVGQPCRKISGENAEISEMVCSGFGMASA